MLEWSKGKIIKSNESLHTSRAKCDFKEILEGCIGRFAYEAFFTANYKGKHQKQAIRLIVVKVHSKKRAACAQKLHAKNLQRQRATHRAIAFRLDSTQKSEKLDNPTHINEPGAVQGEQP